ncbi:Hemolysin, contains CBS domains [Quadrisphaera granulorum]|uniref:CBS domain containing-hemolysin-like protein n=1 Tax=Quadrisphaera granulorum TaxID=317664 RepID=A0A316AHP7_9ACTN|nr:hemolysin family protein [Quadrisphaera granulorum]PWJ56474.1 CBS domain containing-hemolysin-like protein [Quadrisphaera granulorum]SZE95108.1 Hemolysin, contains CBS domains [Quadrisphaera granulorum]
MSWFEVITWTAVIIAVSAFFVAVEFAMLAAKPYRLEDSAGRSRSARAALRLSHELTVVLAGCQLGITACTLALGAITKPAVHYALTPLLESSGMPYWVADVAAFVLALVVVTFLHLVVGEMAPKSWAIAHPETSATLLALPMRGFMILTRPALLLMNEMANAMLRRIGVEPVNEKQDGSTSDDLRQLVEHSANVGALDASYRARITGALDLEQLTLADMLPERPVITAVSAHATAGEVREASRASGHLRVLLHDDDGVPRRVVHVRDTLLLPDGAPVDAQASDVLQLSSGTPLGTALAAMRRTSNQLVLVHDQHDDGAPDGSRGAARGVVTVRDIIGRLFPETVQAPEPVRAPGASAPSPSRRALGTSAAAAR